MLFLGWEVYHFSFLVYNWSSTITNAMNTISTPIPPLFFPPPMVLTWQNLNSPPTSAVYPDYWVIRFCSISAFTGSKSDCWRIIYHISIWITQNYWFLLPTLPTNKIWIWEYPYFSGTHASIQILFTFSLTSSLLRARVIYLVSRE